ncbi:MAG: hypothetical protein DHS20C01_30820 [marine bacterium B5-7]|nr:MAG: hypothetical protein DHS20C01_30820 [marine bacterium B5-7]
MTGWQQQHVLASDHGLPEIGQVDVAVVGGGAAGVAAAETAARGGASVLLIERYGFCGGNAVAGLSGTICGMYYANAVSQQQPTQAVFGFCERFRSIMQDTGGITKPQRYGKTWTVTHDPLVWREVADRLLLDAGVRVLFHTLVVGVVMEDDTITGLAIDGKSGRAVVSVRHVIDASGDADVAFRAGLGYSVGDEGKTQNPTMIFRLGNVDVEAFLDYWGPDTICSAEVSQMIISARESGKFDLPRSKIWLFSTPRPNELLCNATRVVGRDGRDLYSADTEDLTEAEFAGRLQVREYARFLSEHIPGCTHSFVVDTGVQAGIRQSRSILGREQLSNADVMAKRKRSDGIVRSPWPIELHAGEKPKLEWLLDDYYEVPYNALVPERCNNLLIAGRCLSAEHEALASARVTAQCFGYGHAAGTAIIAAQRSGRRPADITGEEVRSLLNADGARLDD